VPDDIRLNANHDINRAIADMVESFAEKSVSFGYWIRPEFTRVNHEDVYESVINTQQRRGGGNAYQYDRTIYPNRRAYLAENGLPLLRANRSTWVRKGRDGSETGGIKTPYDWVPMSLTAPGGWYDKLIYPHIVLQKELGYSSLFQDGGPSSLQGIDYTGGTARACQPYYWRFISDVYRLGMDIHGEVDAGFGGSCVIGGYLQDAARNHFWAFSHCSIRGNRDHANKWFNAQDRHKCCQLYVSANIDLNSSHEHGVVLRYFKEFQKHFGHPDGIVLEGLRRENGNWVWDDVIWERNDGLRVRYPDFDEITDPASITGCQQLDSGRLRYTRGPEGLLVYINASGNFSCALHTASGRSVFQRKGSGPLRFNIHKDGLGHGLYFLTLNMANTTIVKRAVWY
jgi:hypothetical protein